MVHKLVRLALASEYARQPLRRSDITSQGELTRPHMVRCALKCPVLNGRRTFRAVFDGAQRMLQTAFGMSLTELPVKDKVTVQQKRAAKGAGGGGGGASKAWVLTTILPRAYRQPAILAPPRVPSVEAESAYIGLSTFVVSLIYLSPGQRLGERKLEKHLTAANADTFVLEDRTERALRRMEKDGYVVKVREREAGGEETVEWVVGPRGKIEVGARGAAALVKNVYGKRDAELDELEDRLEKSLGAGTFKRRRKGAQVEGVEGQGEEEGQEADEEQDEEENGEVEEDEDE